VEAVGLILARLISNAYKWYDFASAFVIGPQGIGKTTYAMLVAYEVYGDWDMVLDNLYFDPKEALPRFKEALRTGRRLPLVVFDDAGMHLSKYLVSSGREGFHLARQLNALINLARTLTAGVIYTSPDMDILKELRKKAWIVAEPLAPHGKAKPYRVARLYRKRILASGKVAIQKLGLDEYDLRAIPGDVRKQYEEKRREAMEPLLEELEAIWSRG
jgi:hypothetical protein